MRRVSHPPLPNCMLICFVSRCVSPRAASPNPSSRGSSCGIDEEVAGVLSDPELRNGKDRLVRTFPAIHEALLLVTMNRILAPAAADLARRQVHQPRAHRRKSKGSVPCMVFLYCHLMIMKGYICDDPTRMANSAPCVNQDIVDKVRRNVF